MLQTRSFHPPLRILMSTCMLLAAICWPAVAPAVAQDDEIQQRQLLQLMDEVRSSMDADNWLLATQQFDRAWSQICFGEDPVLVLANEGDQQITPGVSTALAGGRARLMALYFDAPDEFQREYSRQFDQIAEDQFADAVAEVASARSDALRRCSRRYPFTRAAQRALQILIRQGIDRGQMLTASLDSGHLLRLAEQSETAVTRLSALQLQHAMLLWQSGLTADAENALANLINTTTDSTVTMGQNTIPLPAAGEPPAQWLARQSPAAGTADPSQWKQPLGDYRRVRQQPHGPAELQNAWSSDLFVVNDVISGSELNPVLSGVPERLKLLAAVKTLDNGTIYPAATPLAVKGQIIFRTPAGVRSVSADDGSMLWEITSPDSRLQQAVSEVRRIQRGSSPNRLPAIQSGLADDFLNQLTRSCPDSQISTDGKTLFVVEDSVRLGFSRVSGLGIGGASSPLPANYIRAYDLASGLLRWEAGGQRAVTLSPNLLAGFYFLGTPLILADRCYVMAENDEGIFLLQLEGPRTDLPASMPKNPRIVHSQLLAIPQYKLNLHPVRRLAGLTPSFANGLLICPTCDERVIAVSPQDHSVRWVFRYEDNIVTQDLGGEFPILAGSRNVQHSESVDLDTRWVDSLPRVAGNNILLTPRDANHLLCLDLQTGTERWRINRGFARCIAAVTSDTVVLSGNKQVSAVSLNDGTPLWSTQVLGGQICGTGVCDGTVLQVPTTEPSIQTFEVATGRRLLTQTLRTNGIPGNLLSVDNRLIWQSLTNVTATTEFSAAGAETPAALATQQLLRADVPAALQTLETAAANGSNDEAVQDLLIHVLLESLRMDYTKYSGTVPQLRRLIERDSVRRQDLGPVVAAMLGMTLNDAAIFPMRHDALNRSQQQIDQLFEIVASGLIDSKDASVEELSVAIGNMLPVLRTSQERITTSGFLSRRNALLLASGIRNVLSYRTAADLSALEQQIRPLVQPEFAGLKFAQGTRLVRTLQLAGLTETAIAAVEFLADGTPRQQQQREALLAQLRLDAAGSLRGEAAATAMVALLQSWARNETDDTLTAAIADLQDLDNETPNAVLGFDAIDPVAAADALKAIPDLVSAAETQSPSPWSGRPIVGQSDDRTLAADGKTEIAMPQFTIPVFGDAGLYRNWSFVQESGSRSIVAFDRSGRRRWQFDPEVAVSPIRSARLQESYLLFSGRLAAIKLQDQLYLVDLTMAAPDNPPTPLWDVNLPSMNNDEEARIFRQFTPGSERVDQYAPAPAGLFPVGPLTCRGLPVLAGRRLVVFDPVTGERMWQLNSLPLDTVLLSTDERVLLVSETSRHVEARDMASGELLTVSELPAWWTEAETNAAMSVRDIDIEPGTVITWRVSVFHDRCLLFRLSSDKALLELRSVTDDAVIWARELPADTVFSNADDGVVALLSDGRQLLLLESDTGKEICQLAVNPVPAPRQLYLRTTEDRWIVLPEAVDDPSLDLDPVMSSMHVYGQMYGIDRSTAELAWQRPIEHMFIRQTIPSQSPILPNAPILVLISRYRKNTEFSFASHMRARVFDSRDGELLYDSGAPEDPGYTDLGKTLNGHGLFIDADRQQLLLGFESRDITFDYSVKTE
jgi:outer membrane protein assembly factor BamB